MKNITNPIRTHYENLIHFHISQASQDIPENIIRQPLKKLIGLWTRYYIPGDITMARPAKYSLNLPHSIKAKELLDKGIKTGLILEHAVPTTLLITYMLDLSNPTVEDIRDILETYCFGIVITKEEDNLLTSLGLRQKMPENWDKKDLLARYRENGLSDSIIMP